LTRLKRNAQWVVADLPHYWTTWVRRVLEASDEIVVTAVPTLASLRNAKSLLEALNAPRRNDAPIRIVLNHVGANSKTEIASREFATALGSAVTVTLPHEPQLFGEAANTGHMVGEAPRAKNVVDALNRLAGIVNGRGDPNPRIQGRKPGLMDKLLPPQLARMTARAKA